MFIGDLVNRIDNIAAGELLQNLLYLPICKVIWIHCMQMTIFMTVTSKVILLVCGMTHGKLSKQNTIGGGSH